MTERGGREHRLGREAIHTCWDHALPPRLTIAPGDVVVCETLEPSWGKLAREVATGGPWREATEASAELVALVSGQAYEEMAKGPGTALSGHALTGPVAIAGATPGDTLVVEILAVAPADWGWTACGPGETGALNRDELTEWVLHLWDLREGTSAQFMPGIRVPLAPFCGVMGVAPAAPGPHSTITPRRVGGNLDVRQLVAGATLHLPVEVPGALFSVGDAHAAQGDGEVAGTGIEMDATVTLRFDLVKDGAGAGPRFFTPSADTAAGPWFAASGSDRDLYAAARQALRGVLDYLEEAHGLARPQCCILASACVDLRVSQIVNGDTYTVSAFLPLSIFEGDG